MTKRRNDKTTKGTILIWTVLLGVAMTSAFFFISMRLGGMGGLQRESIEYKNQEAYLASYVDYLESLSDTDLAAMGDVINFDGITGTITNKVDEIIGVLDQDGSVTYNFAGTINVEWNLCSNNNKETIIIGGMEHPYNPVSLCPGYDDEALLIPVSDPFIISTKNAPIHYKITPVASTQLVDKIWHLKANIDLGYKKSVEVEKTF